MRLPIKDPTEIKVVPFDFSTELTATETITSVEMSIETVTGVDASPSTVLDGTAVIDNPSKQVWQRVREGLNGCDYRIKCLATGNGGLKHLVYGTLPVRNPT